MKSGLESGELIVLVFVNLVEFFLFISYFQGSAAASAGGTHDAVLPVDLDAGRQHCPSYDIIWSMDRGTKMDDLGRHCRNNMSYGAAGKQRMFYACYRDGIQTNAAAPAPACHLPFGGAAVRTAAGPWTTPIVSRFCASNWSISAIRKTVA